MTEYKDNWREIAKASEKDPKVMDILENGPRSLTQAWLLQAMRYKYCLLYTSPSPRDLSTSRMPSSA